jgi:HSP20 family protein
MAFMLRQQEYNMATNPVEVKKTAPTAVPTQDAWQSMRTEMERMFDRFGFGVPAFRRWFDMEPALRSEMTITMPNPAIDIAEDDKGYRLSAELPGMTEQDIDITVTDDMLTLKGEKKQEAEHKDKNYTMSERSYGAFQRSFWLPDGVDRGNIDASFAKGILTVNLPKSPAATAQSKKIEVKAAA